MWVIGFFSVLLVAIFIYAFLQKKGGNAIGDGNEYRDDEDSSPRF